MDKKSKRPIGIITYRKIIIYSLFFGIIMALSIFLEFWIQGYYIINDVILYVPRLIADLFFECGLCPALIYSIPFFTFLFYVLLSILICSTIKKFENPALLVTKSSLNPSMFTLLMPVASPPPSDDFL